MSPAAQSILREAEALLAARRLHEALAHFEHAESLGADPDHCAASRWTAHMLQGNFEAAWKASDAIRQRGAPGPHRFWQGEPLHGKRVMLRSLHGFGDAVQFLRYAPRLREAASRLIVEVPPQFIELASSFDGVEEVITWDQPSAAASEWDVQIEMMELPYLFRTQVHELPLTTKYLKAPQQVDPATEAALSSSTALQVGLAWTAGTWNPSRSLPPEGLQPLLAVDHCQFWSLQSSSEATPKGTLAEVLREDHRCRHSIAGLAALIAQLDLVITVDTLVAHLAGALGVPALVLLQHEADWRWMHERDDSPWYPTLQLLRQPAPGDWQSVVTHAREALQKHAHLAAARNLVGIR